MSFLSKLPGFAGPANAPGNDGGVQGTAITPADVSQRLADAEAALALLRKRAMPLALKVEAGDADAAAKLSELDQQITSGELRVRNLTAALEEAKRIEAIKEQVARENLYGSRRKSSENRMQLARKGAAKVNEGLAIFAEGWRELIEQASMAKTAFPSDVPGWPTFDDLGAWVQREAYRVSRPIVGTDAKLPPGALKPSPFVEQEPEKLRTLTEYLAEACDHAEAQLKAGVPK